MKSLSQVVWSEGMHIGPHEFQAQARYFEDSVHFAASALWFECYGFAACALDADALHNGTVGLLHAAGVFPDGMAFEIPQCDAGPAARPIAELFPPAQDSLTVYLAVAERKAEGRNVALSGNGVTRYSAGFRTFNDETSGTDSRSVQVRCKNIRLLLESELTPGTVTLPLARVRRDGSGHFAFDPDFVPPCLKVTASERLMLVLRRLIELLDAKSSALSRPAGAAAALDYSPRDLANFWLRHAVNSGAAALQHLWTSKRGHPEEVFLEMSRLAGALCTFALDSHPRNLPAYDHLRLGECFDALDRHIRAHLETIVPTNCVAIQLTQAAEWFHEGEITDTRCLGRSRWVLGIHAALGEAELITKAPQLVKVCSAKFVGELVKRAMAGLTLTHIPTPPPALAARADAQYFAISREGPFWDHIVQTRRVGIYVPGDIPAAELELMVLLDR